MKNKILEIKNISKNYHNLKGETKAIENISFDVYDGEFIAIVGPSGCGKSTLLSILANLTDKSSGEIINKDKKKIGYMLQQDSLFPWRSIIDNCLLGLEISKTLNQENKENTINLLKTYGLEDFIDKYPNELSGGMRQRVV
ncbi:MAG: ATP-binding cassette domain-containing protein [Bacilli bacterium]|nr:ATP-binding cassette domain-containing protein [Bacilli bacterium]